MVSAPLGEKHEGEALPSLKDLASSDPAARRTALQAILTHLTSRAATSPLSQIQSLQLWRGFSVALYMHDSKSAVSVQNLIKTLASTFRLVYEKDLEVLSSAGSIPNRNGNVQTDGSQIPEEKWTWLSTHHSAFWDLLCREWADIDSHRLNKYLLLVRLVLRELFAILLTHSASTSILTVASPPTPDLITPQLAILQIWPLSSRERKVPDGLRLHVLDVWSDELIAQAKTAVAEAAAAAAASEPQVAAEVESKEKEESSSPPAKKKRKRGSNPSTASTAAGTDAVSTSTAAFPSKAPTKETINTIAEKLMLPVRALAKEALSKSVKMRAREALTTYEESLAEAV